jgi:hypothetical protein
VRREGNTEGSLEGVRDEKAYVVFVTALPYGNTDIVPTFTARW